MKVPVFEPNYLFLRWAIPASFSLFSYLITIGR